MCSTWKQFMEWHVYIHTYLWRWNHMVIFEYIHLYMYIYIYFFIYFYHQPPISTVDRCWNLHVFQVAESSAVHGTSTQWGFSSFTIQTITTLMRLFKNPTADSSWKPPVVCLGKFSLVVFGLLPPNLKSCCRGDKPRFTGSLKNNLPSAGSMCKQLSGLREKHKQKRGRMHQKWNMAMKKQHAQEEIHPTRSLYLICVHTSVSYVDHSSSTPVKAPTRIHQPSAKKRRDDGAPWKSGYRWNGSALMWASRHVFMIRSHVCILYIWWQK